uniref:Uncharacterized protein n=2 Tax=Ixodes scapularis TaxID=6945 RepID=A0A1S4M3D9_IXOSC
PSESAILPSRTKETCRALMLPICMRAPAEPVASLRRLVARRPSLPQTGTRPPLPSPDIPLLTRPFSLNILSVFFLKLSCSTSFLIKECLFPNVYPVFSLPTPLSPISLSRSSGSSSDPSFLLPLISSHLSLFLSPNTSFPQGLPHFHS